MRESVSARRVPTSLVFEKFLDYGSMRFDQFIVMSGKLAATKLQPNRVLSRKKSEAPTATVKRKTVRIKSKSVKEFFRSFTKLNEKDPSSGKSHTRKSKDKEKDKENRPKSKTKRRADPQQIVYTKRKILYVIKGKLVRLEVSSLNEYFEETHGKLVT